MSKQTVLFFICLIIVFGNAYNAKAQNMPDRKNKDVALLFAVEDYQNMKKLNKPIDDALKLKDYLENRYGFSVELVRNPDLRTVKSKLKEYADKYRRKVLDNTGQLLVFFSGHGLPADMTGFFVPSDGDPAPDNIYSTCYSYNQMRGQMKRIDVNHKLLIVDACYSAYLNPLFEKGRPVFDKPIKLTAFEKELMVHNNNKSFEYITSDASGNTTPDNSQLMAKLFEGFEYSDTRYGFIKLNILVPTYLSAANPQPYYERLGEDIGKTSFMFFKKINNIDIVIILKKQFGIIELDSKIKGDLYIDGKNEGSLNAGVYTLKNISPGTHHLKINGWEQTVTVNSGQTVNVTAKSNKPEVLPNYLNDRRNGRRYKTVEIGNQVWMAENLAFKTASGSWAYDNSQSNVTEYGYLYDWETAKTVCPSGWHLPNDEEWKQLEINQGMSSSRANKTGWRGDAGKTLKSTSGWDASGNGNNSSGFNALPGGKRGSDGSFDYLGKGASFWSSSPNGSDEAWGRKLGYYDGEVSRDSWRSSGGYSVRCIQD